MSGKRQYDYDKANSPATKRELYMLGSRLSRMITLTYLERFYEDTKDLEKLKKNREEQSQLLEEFNADLEALVYSAGEE